MKDDLKKIIDAALPKGFKTLALFGSYAKGEGYLLNGHPVNDLDLLLVDSTPEQETRFRGITASVPLEFLLISSQELAKVAPTQMWWEISYANQLILGDPLNLPKWNQWEIPYWDAVQSLNKRVVSLIIGKHELMKENPDYLKVRSQIGKMIIALGDAVLIKRGQFDYRYAVRSHMLMHDDIGDLYRLAVSWKLLNWPETDPDQLWVIWNAVKDRTRDYITHKQLNVLNLDALLEVTETKTPDEVANIIKLLNAEKWI
jgi:predicted nucleotidyltransferase